MCGMIEAPDPQYRAAVSLPRPIGPGRARTAHIRERKAASLEAPRSLQSTARSAYLGREAVLMHASAPTMLISTLPKADEPALAGQRAPPEVLAGVREVAAHHVEGADDELGVAEPASRSRHGLP
jgi:hypothetical protein